MEGEGGKAWRDRLFPNRLNRRVSIGSVLRFTPQIRHLSTTR